MVKKPLDVMGEQMQSVSLDGVEYSIPKNFGTPGRNSHDSGHCTDDEHSSLTQSQESLEHSTRSREETVTPQSSDPHFVDERDSSEDGLGEGDSSEEDVEYVRFGTRPTEARPTERRSQITVNPDSVNTHFDISQSQNNIHVGTQYSLHLSPDLIQVLHPGETVAVEFPRENAVIRISMEGLDKETEKAMERQIMENLGQPSFFSQLYTTVWRWSLGILRVFQIRRGCIEIVLASDDKKATDLLKAKIKDGLLDEDIRALLLQDNVMKIANGANFKLKIELVENDQVDAHEPPIFKGLNEERVESLTNQFFSDCASTADSGYSRSRGCSGESRGSVCNNFSDSFFDESEDDDGVALCAEERNPDYWSHTQLTLDQPRPQGGANPPEALPCAATPADHWLNPSAKKSGPQDGTEPLKKSCLTHDEVASTINKLSAMCQEEGLKAETAWSPMGWWPRSNAVPANKARFKEVRVEHGRDDLSAHTADYVGDGLVKAARTVGTLMAWPLLPVKVAWMGLQSTGLFRKVIDVDDALLKLPPLTQLLLYHSVQDALKGMRYPPGTPIGVALADEKNRGKILEILKAFITDELSMKIVTTPRKKDVGLAQSKEQRSRSKFLNYTDVVRVFTSASGRKNP